VEKVRGALKIAASCRRAARLGLSPGLTLADARARVPDLRAAASDPEADARLLRDLAEVCERFTPMAALDGSDGLMLDITGCAHLFGDEAALRERICVGIGRLGLGTRASIAGTPDAARALARFSRHHAAPPGSEEALMRPLPIAALELDAEAAVALARAGLRRIGDLADLPPAALTARFGSALTLKLRRVLGHEDRRITPLRPTPDCMAARRFAEPLLEADALLKALEGLVEEVAAQLAGQGRGGRAFTAAIFRTDGLVRSLRIETGRPSRDPRSILRLFRERMEGLADPIDPGFGFDALRLHVASAEPFDIEEPDFDGRAAQEAELAELIDRLATQFGRDRVQRFTAGDTHDPIRGARRICALETAASVAADTAWPAQEQGEPPLRPLHLFDPPQPVEVLAEVPDEPPSRFRWRRVVHDVARAEGPERIAPEWWRGAATTIATRDYYRIEDSEGRRFWLFRQGFYGDDAGPRWFVHGLFA